MTSFSLKIIAIIAMTFDHTAHLLPSDTIAFDVFHAIGRLTFPIMAFLFLEGYMHTRNKVKYAQRLFIFALISVVPFLMLFGTPFNVMFTFLFTILMFMLIEKHPRYEPLFVIAFTILAIPFDWGFVGVLAMYIMYKIKDKNMRIIFGVTSIFLITIVGLAIVVPFTKMMNEHSYVDVVIAQTKFFLPVLLAIPILLTYNGKRGKSMKYFFYIYYPAHLMVLGLVYKFV